MSVAYLIGGATVRSFGVGFLAVTFGFMLANRGFSEPQIGIIIGSGLAGLATGTLLASLYSDRLGRTRSVVAVCCMMAVGGVTLSFAESMSAFCAAAFIGMTNGMGRDRGAAQVIDQSLLAGLSTITGRTRVFATYSIFTDLGTAAGAFAAALPLERAAFGPALLLYSALVLLSSMPYLRVRAESHVASHERGMRLSAESRRRVRTFAGLSVLDSLGGGFITRSLLAYWFVERFDAGPGWVGVLFGGASLVNALSYGTAAWLAKRIGLVNTMVFTHIPSSILLMLVPFAPSFSAAGAMFLLREFFAPMDVPTRQSYLSSIVKDHERTAAAGYVNLARNASWSVGPGLAGWAMTVSLSFPLFATGILKIAYDVLLWRSFQSIKPE